MQCPHGDTIEKSGQMRLRTNTLRARSQGQLNQDQMMERGREATWCWFISRTKSHQSVSPGLLNRPAQVISHMVDHKSLWLEECEFFPVSRSLPSLALVQTHTILDITQRPHF